MASQPPITTRTAPTSTLAPPAYIPHPLQMKSMLIPLLSSEEWHRIHCFKFMYQKVPGYHAQMKNLRDVAACILITWPEIQSIEIQSTDLRYNQLHDLRDNLLHDLRYNLLRYNLLTWDTIYWPEIQSIDLRYNLSHDLRYNLLRYRLLRCNVLHDLRYNLLLDYYNLLHDYYNLLTWDTIYWDTDYWDAIYYMTWDTIYYMTWDTI